MFGFETKQILVGVAILSVAGYLIFKFNIDENVSMASQTWRQQNLISEKTFAGCRAEDEVCFGNSLNRVNFLSSTLDLQQFFKIRNYFCFTKKADCEQKFELFFLKQIDLKKLNFPENPRWEDKIEIVFSLNQLNHFLEKRSTILKKRTKHKKDLAAKSIEKIEDIQSVIAVFYPKWLVWYDCIKGSKSKKDAKVCMNAPS